MTQDHAKAKDWIVESLRERMRELGISQTELAAEIKVSEASVSRWLSGESVLSASSYELIRRFFKAKRKRPGVRD